MLCYLRWCDDAAFGRQRLAGVHNNAIRICTEIPRKLAVSSDILDVFLEGSTLPLALSDRRIFIVDLDILDGVPARSGFVMCAPVALFFQRNNGSLVPIAIQLFQQHSDDNPVFLPSDSMWTWTLAKMWFNNADHTVHQAAQHMCNTHLLMEGVYVITQRNLSQSHPLYKLIAPHVLYVVPINFRAMEKLLSPDGWVNKVMSAGLEGMQEIVRRQKLKWRLDIDGILPKELKSRGVEDSDILPEYYFREDATMLYDVIRSYVSNYVNLYYECDEDVLEDEELQQWREEMVKPCTDGGLGLNGVPGKGGQFRARHDVVSVMCWVVYTCSVGHAAVNRKQYDEYAFPPNSPGHLKGAPPTDKRPLTEQDVLDALPDRQETLDIMTVMNMLSNSRGNPLGNFDVNYIFDPKAIQVVKEFKEELKRISSVIKQRNRRRAFPYDALDPENVSNTLCI